MSKFINRIVSYILERRRKKIEKIREKLKPKTYTNSTSKTHISETATLTLTTETEKNKEKVDAEVRTIVKNNLKNPEKLLDFIKEHGTPVYRLKNADKILEKIKEDEGFITPLKGFKAFYLNLMVGEKWGFKTREMFVLRPGEVNVYFMMHQFHKWYGFKEDLPGYDAETQDLFKENFENLKDSDFSDMSIKEIIALKEAIARDAEAVDFVVNMAKEHSGAKKALEKMKKDGGANI